MIKAPPFASPLAPHFKAFLDWRRLAGYRLRVTELRLRAWDRFLQGRLLPGEPLTRKLVEGWLAAHANLCGRTRRQHFYLVCAFCRFLRQTDARTFVPEPWARPSQSQTRQPYLYQPQEIAALLVAAKQLPVLPDCPLRAASYHALIWLLASTGLRVSEALRLTLADVDLENGVLRVGETKFRKSRLVPLARGTTEMLRDYHHARLQSRLPSQPDSPFFVSRRRRAYSYQVVVSTFVSLLRQTGIRQPAGPGPRLHDLRHTFAVRRLLEWYRSGADLNSRLPLLSTYLGHAKVSDTALYLHATAELLEEANGRFHNFVKAALREEGRDEE